MIGIPIASGLCARDKTENKLEADVEEFATCGLRAVGKLSFQL